MTITLPNNSGPCLPAFSTPFRASDYLHTLLDTALQVKYLASTPSQFIQMLRDLESADVYSVTIDRCPRCPIFTVFKSASVKTPDDVVKIWAIIKSGEIARAELYFTHALASARGGQFEVAREVVLETVGHVTQEDPRLHLLIGQLAIKLRDQKLFREARAYLEFLKLDAWGQKLDQAKESGSPYFENW